MMYVYKWKPPPKERARLYGKRCRIIPNKKGRRFNWNYVVVEFEDGTRIPTSRKALKEVNDAQMV